MLISGLALSFYGFIVSVLMVFDNVFLVFFILALRLLSFFFSDFPSDRCQVSSSSSSAHNPPGGCNASLICALEQRRFCFRARIVRGGCRTGSPSVQCVAPSAPHICVAWLCLVVNIKWASNHSPGALPVRRHSLRLYISVAVPRVLGLFVAATPRADTDSYSPCIMEFGFGGRSFALKGTLKCV